jgi:hypothetical protein
VALQWIFCQTAQSVITRGSSIEQRFHDRKEATAISALRGMEASLSPAENRTDYVVLGAEQIKYASWHCFDILRSGAADAAGRTLGRINESGSYPGPWPVGRWCLLPGVVFLQRLSKRKVDASSWFTA